MKEVKNLVDITRNIHELLNTIIDPKKTVKPSLDATIKEVAFYLQNLSDVDQIIVNFSDPHLKKFSIGIGDQEDSFYTQENLDTIIFEKIIIETANGPKIIGNSVFFFKKNPSSQIKEWVNMIIKTISHAAESELLRIQVHKLNKESIDYFVTLIKTKDFSTYQHCYNVSLLTGFLCKIVGMDSKNTKLTTEAALLHDIGKINVNDCILNKPAQLTNEEFTEMKKHPQYGYNMLIEHENFKEHAAIILQHHERYDGSGYPNGLKGSKLLLSSRILAIADTFDAMLRIRPYKKFPSDLSDIINELRKNAGTQFDPQISSTFAELLERREFVIFPAVANN